MIFLLVVFLLLCAFFTACEISFIACDKVKIRAKGAIFALSLVEKPTKFLAPILCGINISTIAFGVIATKIWGEKLPEVLIILLSTLIVLVFGEILPKTLAQRAKERIVVVSTRIILFFYWLFYPIEVLIIVTSNRVLKFLKSFRGDTQKELSFGKEEIYYASKEALSIEEVTIISEFLDFEDTIVREVMIPKEKIWCASVNSTKEDILDIVLKSGHSRIPIYRENLDDIIGIIYVKDLIKEDDISKIIRPCMFIPERRKISTLFTEMKNKEEFRHIAIVKDEYGKTSGLVTLEDILEELFGEITDEYESIKR